MRCNVHWKNIARRWMLETWWMETSTIYMHANYSSMVGWDPRLASKVKGKWGLNLIMWFRSMARDWYSEVVAPPTTLCTMGVTWPSRRGMGNDGLEWLFGQPTDYPICPHQGYYCLPYTWLRYDMVTWHEYRMNARVTVPWHLDTTTLGHYDTMVWYMTVMQWHGEPRM